MTQINHVIRAEASPDGGYTGTIDDMPGCISEGDDLCELLRNLAAAAAIWSGDPLLSMQRETPDRLSLFTSREGAGDTRESITCWIEPTLEETDPAQLRNLTLVSGATQVAITHLGPEALTQLGLWLIDAAASAAAKR